MNDSSQAVRAATLRTVFAGRIVVIDGAMGTMIQKHRFDEAAYRGDRFRDWHRDLKGCNDLLVITRPQVIADIHAEFIDADPRTGKLELIAGTGQKGNGGDGDPLQCAMARLHGVFVDADGAVYIGDSEAHKVRVLRKR